MFDKRQQVFPKGILELFIKNGANVNQVLEISKGAFTTPLLTAMEISLNIGQGHDNLSQVELLLRAGANPNLTVERCKCLRIIDPTETGTWTPLLLAIYMHSKPCSIRLVKMLLDAGADVNQRATPLPYYYKTNMQGIQTPLSFSINLGLKDVVELLLERGAKL